jgi:hypothetical protein
MEERRRPLGIWIIVILEIVNAVINLTEAVTGWTISPSGLMVDDSQSVELRAVVIAFSVLVILASVWLWLLRRRGWAAMMLLVGLALAAQLTLWWLRPADTQWLRMGLNVIAAFYLNSAGVRGLFLHHHETSRISLGGRDER